MIPSASLLDVSLDEPAVLALVPVVSPEELRSLVIDALSRGCRLAALFGWPVGGDTIRVAALLADPGSGMVHVTSTEACGTWKSLTPDCPQAHLFERELAEQWGLGLVGHPWCKPLRFHAPHCVESGGREDLVPGVTDFFRVAGDEVHEVAVGPVHAGIIEPGHFRFQCHGETVLHLEIAHGYQHRGVERSMVGGPTPRTIHSVETLAGDTSVGHATAYGQLLETLGGCRVPLRGQAIRAVALELERVANHTGDLGALAGDVGFLPTASFCGRLRGDVLNMTASLCGNRFGRGIVRPGGAAFDAETPLAAELVERLTRAGEEITQAVELLWESPSARARLENAGVLEADKARVLGVVGPPARATGQAVDARADFPTGFFRFAQLPVATLETGDALARGLIRSLEIQSSIVFVCETLGALPAGPTRVESRFCLPPEHLAVTCVEGWRGEIWHAAVTDSEGRLARYKVVDPSFHNWPAVASVMRGVAISDFPLCNKSFNLSYCGFDL